MWCVWFLCLWFVWFLCLWGFCLQKSITYNFLYIILHSYHYILLVSSIVNSSFHLFLWSSSLLSVPLLSSLSPSLPCVSPLPPFSPLYPPSLPCVSPLPPFSPLCLHNLLFYRHSKPFNPLLGETYELVRQDEGYCLLAEQVRCYQ